MIDATPANAGGKQDTRFKKGQSGNPQGKPKGLRARVTTFAENLLDGQAEAIVQAIIRSALNGDSTAQRVCLDRILPARRDRPIILDIGPLVSAQDGLAALGQIVLAMAQGDITPPEAGEAARPIEAFLRGLQTNELEQLLAQFEEKVRGGK
jgi:hypothetical protein